MRNRTPQKNEKMGPARDPWFNKPKQVYLEEAATRILFALRDIQKANTSLAGAILWAGSSELSIGEFWVHHDISSPALDEAAQGLKAMLVVLLGKMALPEEFLLRQFGTPRGLLDEMVGPTTGAMAKTSVA